MGGILTFYISPVCALASAEDALQTTEETKVEAPAVEAVVLPVDSSLTDDATVEMAGSQVEPATTTEIVQSNGDDSIAIASSTDNLEIDSRASSTQAVASSTEDNLSGFASSSESVASSTEDILSNPKVELERSLAPPVLAEEKTITDWSNLAISAEFSGNGVSSNGEDDNLAISDEFSGTGTNSTGDQGDEGAFTTLPQGNDQEDSDEGSFSTLPGTDSLATSTESFFSTLGGGNETEIVVSDESSFTTLASGNEVVGEENSFTTSGGGGGCVSNCGGGGGGGGGGSSIITQEISPRFCAPYLLKYIKYGADNDPREVRKLQAFLRVFQNETGIAITGYYDRKTFEAVERFQRKYSRDVLGPWAITDSTGYVFITTRVAINRVFCGFDTTNKIDLANYYGRIRAELGEGFVLPEFVATTTSATSAVEVLATSSAPRLALTTRLTNFLQTAAIGTLDFVREIPCWLWNILWLIIVLLLLVAIWLKRDDDQNQSGPSLGGNTLHGQEDDNAWLFGLSGALTESGKEEQNPDQVVIPLTAETKKEKKVETPKEELRAEIESFSRPEKKELAGGNEFLINLPIIKDKPSKKKEEE